ncbi:MAG TPA: hypothetical protein VEX68_21620 [Bryobacteraceae bacterium]|nr:hypothetical protein [Bryobacteraceae bacterium]
MKNPAEGLTNCSCCAGLAQETPQVLYNRSGLAAIAYRVGDRAQFKASMLARLHTLRSLNGLRTRDDDDFTIALFDAFASMSDVLTFYTERIANEAYLRTATERLSVVELAQLIGYQPRPGVAASTWLAFTIEDAPGAFGAALIAGTISQVVPEVPPTVTIDIGAKVQSIPGTGELPQTFETVEKIYARSDWNAMQARQTQPQTVSLQSGSFILNGAINTLKVGDTLLLIDAQGHKALKPILNVAVAEDSKTTQVDVAVPSGSALGFLPATLTLPSLTEGKAYQVAPNTELNNQVVKQILNAQWDADELATLAKQQKWPLQELSADINKQVALDSKAAGNIFVFRQKIASFGYNAPVWGSLQPNLRFDSTYLGVSPAITLTAPFPTDWENFTLENRADAKNNIRNVFLDSSRPEVVAGSWIALRSPSDQPEGNVAIAQVTSNAEVARTDFTLSAKVSRLRIQQAAALTLFPIRETVILCQSENLPLAEVPIPDVIEGKTIVLNGACLGLAAGRRVAVSGERADLEGESAAEVRMLDKVVLVGGFTVVTVDKALQYPYKRRTMRINGNLAQGTNGETVNELLGNGDGSQPFQQFKLRQNPLTYVPAATPSGGKSTLEVRVNGVLWEEVPYLFGHGPAERIYSTRQDDDAVTWVMFGDGKTGARLPTGEGNVTAKYRKGIGLGGEVKANQLSQILQKPIGVRSANNPLPAGGAADPEILEDARRNAVLPITTFGRVVSLQDYQDFARAFSGVEKALATWTWSGEQRVVLLTVAGAKGAAISDGSALHSSLRKAIAAFSEPGVVPFLYTFDPVFFRVAGTVGVDSAYLIDKVRADVEAALRKTFSFEARQFGQPVHPSEVVATIQAVDGVVDVDLDQPTQHVAAALPRVGKSEFFAAQLLSLDPRRIELEFTQ